MANNIIPVFYDHSHKGILTYWKTKECTEDGARSIVDICKENNLSQCFGVSSNFYTFIEAWDNLKEQNILFSFGLEVLLENNHKIIVFLKSENAYKKAIKLYAAWKANLENKSGENYFLSYKDLIDNWSNDDFLLIIPYFDSFIYKNLLTFNSIIIPNFAGINKENIFIQKEVDSGLPFSQLIDSEIDKYIEDQKLSPNNIIYTKSCYYEKKEDFIAWQVNQCIHNRSTFDKPNKEFMCSDNFSFEDWQNLTKV